MGAPSQGALPLARAGEAVGRQLHEGGVGGEANDPPSVPSVSIGRGEKGRQRARSAHRDTPRSSSRLFKLRTRPEVPAGSQAARS